jgi:hypothetical protein
MDSNNSNSRKSSVVRNMNHRLSKPKNQNQNDAEKGCKC